MLHVTPDGTILGMDARALTQQERAVLEALLAVDFQDKVVADHHGGVTAEERPGGGALLRVWLPTAAAPPAGTGTSSGRPIGPAR